MKDFYKNITRLEYLAKMLSKYRNSWNDSPSVRMLQWFNEYTQIKENAPEAFKAYCQKSGADESHDATDILA